MDQLHDHSVLQPDHPLGLIDIASVTIAGMGPAFSFYFGFAVVAAAAGVGAPLVVAVAAVAFLLLGNTLSVFSGIKPSSGHFVTYLGMSFGGVTAVITSILYVLGYILMGAGVMAVGGGWVEQSLQQYAHITIPWPIFAVIIVGGSAIIMVRGVKISAVWASVSMVVEVAILLGVATAALVETHIPLKWSPLSPAHITRGWAGLGLAFPLASYFFIGFENSAALAEETTNPRKNVPRAIMTSIVIMAFIYLYTAFGTITGFHDNIHNLAQASIPFITVADRILGPFSILAALAGLSSTLGVILSGGSNVARVFFNSCREGLFFSKLGTTGPRGTPQAAIITVNVIQLALALLIGGLSGGYFNAFGELSTLGAIPAVLVYGASNVALIVYAAKHPEMRKTTSWWRYTILPILGVGAIILPLWGLVQPGQPSPYNLFPLIIVGLIAFSLLYGLWKVHRDPQLATRLGTYSTVVDESHQTKAM